MRLTKANYYGKNANRIFMSKSQFSSWQRCEAATLAELNGEFIPEPSTALLVGSYVDAAMDSAKEMEKFKAEHPEIFNSRTGELKADFKQAEVIVERIKRDRLFTLLCSGKKQVILNGSIGGVPFRGKVDSLLDTKTCKLIMKEFPQTEEVLGGMFCEGCIVDLKTTRDFEPVWNAQLGARQNWIEAWDYVSQGAIYQELYRQMTGKALPFVIIAVTKEKEPDIGAFFAPQNELDAALRIVEEQAPVFQLVKDGEVEPHRCGHCAWCKSTKVLTGIQSYKEV